MTPQAPRISSPCIRHCCLDEADVCLGCFRALEEITGWQAAGDQQRRDILHRAEQRRRARNRHDTPPQS